MFRAPSHAGLPSLADILADLPANPAQVARHLGISTVTLSRYAAAGQAPRAVMLALFWETRWGRSVADTEAANWASLQQQRVIGMERYVGLLRERITALEAEIEASGPQAANQPFFAQA